MNSTVEIKYAAEGLVAKFSAYARADGPVPPGGYHCPLTHGIPATASVIGRLATYRPTGTPVTRTEVRRALRHVEQSLVTIGEYVDWLAGLIDRFGGSDSRGRALATARTYLADLCDAQTVLEALVLKAEPATRRRRAA